MSIVEQPQNESKESVQQTTAADASKQPRRRGRLGKFVIAVVLGIAALAWFAPTIISATGMLNSLVGYVVPKLDGQVQIDGATLGWLSPIELRSVSLKDTEAGDLAIVDNIATEKTLWTLLRDQSDIGKVTITNPRLNIVVRENGSNVEDVLEILLSEPKTQQRKFHVVIDNAVTSISAEDAETLEINNLDAEISNLSDQSTFDINTTGTVQDGKFELSAIARHSDAIAFENVSFDSNELPLKSTSPLLVRFGDNSVISGLMTGSVKADKLNPTEMSLLTDVTLKDLDLSVAALFGDDQLRAESMKLHGTIQRASNNVAVDMNLNSNLGQIDLNATVDLDRLREAGFFAGLMQTAKSQEFSAEGDVDLQQLAEALPHVLHIREGAHIDSGRLTFKTESVDTEDAHAWIVNLNASDLKVDVGGEQQHAWKSPVKVNAKLRTANDSFIIDELECHSDFLTVTGSGSTTNANLIANADLDLLMNEVGQLIDLGDLDVSGKSTATFKIQLENESTAEIRGHAELNDFQLTAAGQDVSEKHLTIDFNSTGKLSDSRLTELIGAVIEIKSGTDKLQLDFVEPINWNEQAASYDARLTLIGSAASWKARAAQFISLQTIDIAGQLNAEANIQLHGDELSISDAQLNAKPFQFSNESLRIDEPELSASGNGVWNRLQQRLAIDTATIQSQSLTADISELAVALVTEDESSTNGIIKFNGDLGRIQQWLKSDQPPSTKATGSISGTMKLDHRGQISTAALVARVSQLELLGLTEDKQWKPFWSKQQVDAKSNLQYVPSTDKLIVDQFTLSTQAGVLNLTGDINELTSTADADLKGDMEYDVAEVVTSFKEIVGGSVSATGRQKRTLELNGPLTKIVNSEVKSAQRVPPELIALGGVGWQSANFYGLDAGPASIDAKLKKQVLQFTPVSMTVGGGRVNLAPQFRFDTEATRLLHGKADVIQQVRLSREVCREWLKFVAPQVADSTEVEGHFSLSLSETDVPIDDPASGKVAGVLGIQSAKVSGGPMILSIASIASRVEGIVRRRSPRQILNATKPLFQIRDQNVAFKLTDRRMYHSDFEVIVDNMPITTSGSVGFDETLDLMVRFPIPEAWLGSVKYLSFLRGVELEVPISGTLSRPKVDERVFATLLRRIGRDSVKKIINNGVESQLKKLFGR